MNIRQLKNIIKNGEGIHTEFKKCSFKLPKNVFDTICAFLNRNGGHLLLGVNDDGTIEGVFEGSTNEIVNSLITSCNDPIRLSPTFYLSTEVFDIEGKKVIYVYVPESSQVHNTVGRIFDRNEDGDFDITSNHSLVSQLFLRKQSTFSENTIYPYMTLNDFELPLFDKVRIMARNQRANHPWQDMNNDQLLKSASLWKKDLLNGNEGYTLAAAVLFGTEQTIINILPHYKTDAILRIENIDRYDDRDDIRGNLISAYSRLNEFIKKHLPDKFYIEGTQRLSIRDKIFREIVANLLIHREFNNHFPAKLIIEADKVYTENGNKPHGVGTIDPGNFSPFPKNPTIARFFKEIGWVDELGSGVRNTSKYCNIYNGNRGQAEFIEGDIFKTIVPVPIVVTRKASVSKQVPLTIEPDLVELAVNDVINDSGGGRGGDDGGGRGGDDGGGTLADEVKAEIIRMIRIIKDKPGLKAGELAEIIDKPKRTLERYISISRKLEIISFKGKLRKGGYYLTENFKKRLKND